MSKNHICFFWAIEKPQKAGIWHIGGSGHGKACPDGPDDIDLARDGPDDLDLAQDGPDDLDIIGTISGEVNPGAVDLKLLQSPVASSMVSERPWGTKDRGAHILFKLII